MTYIPDEAKVIYRSKDGKSDKAFDALEWLAAMLGAAKPCEAGCSHVPNKGEQMVVRYYGYYSPAVVAGSRAKEEGKRGRLGTLDPATRGITQRVPEELGKAHTENRSLSRT